jgi:hypothetical protein
MFSDDQIHDHNIITNDSHRIELLFSKMGYHYGTVLHMTVTMLNSNITCTYTTQQATEKGLVFKFVNIESAKKAISLLLDAARYQRDRWTTALQQLQ